MNKKKIIEIRQQDRPFLPLILILCLEIIIAYVVAKADVSDNIFTHLMYIPIVITAFYFDIKISLLSSIIAELLIDAFSPVKQSFLEPANFQVKLFRFAFFIFAGIIFSLLKTGFEKKHKNEFKQNKNHPFTQLPYWNSFKDDFVRLIKIKKIIHFRFLLIEINNQNELLATFGINCINKINDEIINYLRSEVKDGKIYLIRLNTFGLLLPDIHHNIYRLIQLFDEPIVINGIPLYCEISIGEASYPESGHTPDELLKNGFLALNEAKKHQKPYQQYNMKLSNPEIPVLLGQFQSAIKSKEIDFHYQPIIERDNEVCSLEALVRWKHPIKGLIPPNDFIPDLEFTRMTNHLTYYSLDVNLARMHELFEAGFNLNIAINISITNLLQPDFAGNIISILKKYNFPAHHLALEITERGFISDDIESQKNLNTLVHYGVNISIDDFGAGFTSISNFHKNTISSVKIDQSFIKNIHINQNNQAILKGIISIAKSSDIVVIVEGIEKKSEKEKVLELGVDCLQGYYIAKPLDFPSVKKWLSTYPN